jgi:HD-GYP domain-containing protein (c-di-GMP phosphodiesterase class II)
MEPTRLSDVLSSLALAIDLGLGVPLQTVHRKVIVAVRLGKAAGLSEADLKRTYWIGFLRYVGCTTTSHDDSYLTGDELALGDLLVATDEEVMPLLQDRLTKDKTPIEAQAALDRAFAALGEGYFRRNHSMHCEAARLLASRLGLDPETQAGLLHVYERWDGQSQQQLAEGEGISLPMRVVQAAEIVAYFAPTRKSEDIRSLLRARSGTRLDPRLVTLLAEDIGHFLEGLEVADLGDAVLDAEPGESLVLNEDEIEGALSAIADFGDFKSPHMLGHSRRVAALAAASASAASLPRSDVAAVSSAGLIHDIGRVGLQAHLWSRSGELGRADRERVRLHSYLTSRIFAENRVLAHLGSLGSTHHERLDGSGYHRALSGPSLTAAARILAVANRWCSLTEFRPHRKQLSEAEAARTISIEAKDRALDARAVDAVLTAAGQRGANTRRSASLALSEREIEVLRLVAKEETNPSIAEKLGLSTKTVERHVTHIYDKIGVSTRAGAAIYTLENGLF